MCSVAGLEPESPCKHNKPLVMSPITCGKIGSNLARIQSWNNSDFAQSRLLLLITSCLVEACLQNNAAYMHRGRRERIASPHLSRDLFADVGKLRGFAMPRHSVKAQYTSHTKKGGLSGS